MDHAIRTAESDSFIVVILGNERYQLADDLIQPYKRFGIGVLDSGGAGRKQRLASDHSGMLLVRITCELQALRQLCDRGDDTGAVSIGVCDIDGFVEVGPDVVNAGTDVRHGFEGRATNG